MSHRFTKEQLSQFKAPTPPHAFAARVLEAIPQPRRLQTPLFVWAGVAALFLIVSFLVWRTSREDAVIALQPVEILPPKKQTTEPAASLVAPSTAPTTLRAYGPVIELYRKGMFKSAAKEARTSSPPDEELATKLDAFEIIYSMAVTKFAAGERATLYETFKEAMALDLSISSDGIYQDKLAPKFAECAESLAAKTYREAYSPTVSNSKLREAYLLAKEGRAASSTPGEPSIMTEIKQRAISMFGTAKKAIEGGKTDEALKMYAEIMAFMPSGTNEHTAAKKLHEALLSNQSRNFHGGLRGDKPQELFPEEILIVRPASQPF